MHFLFLGKMFKLTRVLNYAVSRRSVRAVTSLRESSDNSYEQESAGIPRKWHLLAALIFGGGTVAVLKDKDMRSRFSLNLLPVVNAATAKVLKGRREQFNFISDVVTVSAPSVVYIEIQDTKRVDYFSGQPVTASNGSGFIVDEDGLILTNAHVVINKPFSRVQVKLNDGRVFPGTVEDVDSGELGMIKHTEYDYSLHHFSLRSGHSSN